MSTTLDDFFGDGSADNIPECSFCGKQDGKLIVSISDAYGPSHWHHVACKEADDATKGTPITPTWDEAQSICVCDFPNRSAMTMAEWEAADGHFNQAGGYCCPHYGNTCGHCQQYDNK